MATQSKAIPIRKSDDQIALPSIEALALPQDNAMIDNDGNVFAADNPEDAMIFHVEHGAVPAHPERWPWPELSFGEPVTARLICPCTEVCFPNGIDPSWESVTCVHGSYDL